MNDVYIREMFKDYRTTIGKPADESALVEQPSVTYSHFKAGAWSVIQLLKEAIDVECKLDMLTAITLGTKSEALLNICEFLRSEIAAEEPDAGSDEWKKVKGPENEDEDEDIFS